MHLPVRTNLDGFGNQLLMDDSNVPSLLGTGFLQNMVRILVGTLLEVGRGRWQPQQVQSILEARDRAQAGPTAPPEGLCLMKVDY